MHAMHGAKFGRHLLQIPLTLSADSIPEVFDVAEFKYTFEVPAHHDGGMLV